MTKYFAAYAATAVVMVALDLVWLGLIAKPLYQHGIGHLMGDDRISRWRWSFTPFMRWA